MMERTNKKSKKGIMWKKLGKGSFKVNNRMIKPGQIFEATYEDIPKAFRDIVVPVDGATKEDLDYKVRRTKKISHKYVKIEGTETYNIVNKSGDVLNDEPLTKKEAKKLITELEA